MDYLVSFQCFGYIVSMVFKIYSQRIMVRTEIWNITHDGIIFAYCDGVICSLHCVV